MCFVLPVIPMAMVLQVALLVAGCAAGSSIPADHLGAPHKWVPAEQCSFANPPVVPYYGIQIAPMISPHWAVGQMVSMQNAAFVEKNLILESIAHSRVLPQASNGANLMRLQWSRFWVYIINYTFWMSWTSVSYMFFFTLFSFQTFRYFQIFGR